MTTVVISQPMLFPWVGMLEQIRLADVHVHYDDVAFSKGSFTNRVQLKGPGDPVWMTLPLANRTLGIRIDELRSDERKDWRRQHLHLLEALYADAPHRDEMLALVETVYRPETDRVGEIVKASLLAVCNYFDIATRWVESRDLGISGKGSERVLAIVRHLGGSVYVTGHGARQYLDHEGFAAAGVEVRYLDYEKRPYPQLHGPFTPYVSSLDLIANLGKAGREVIASKALSWRQFLSR